MPASNFHHLHIQARRSPFSSLCLWAFLLLLAACAPSNDKDVKTLYSDDFSGDLSNWIVEQQPEGKVYVEDGRLVIADKAGCTVWFREHLAAPVVISYTVMASSQERVSDINCFWMASDPESPDDIFARSRSGAFADYDSLQTYYVGFGGNHNTTTRFRRYAGTGERPLLPEHDRQEPEFMIEPDRPYRIKLIAADGRARYYIDDKLIFSFDDPNPLTQGWFGFRTVWSRLIIDDFQVSRP